jgi:chitinase
MRGSSQGYLQFVNLHSTLGDRFNLPPKRLLVTSFVPSAWVDDALIAERKSGLSKYLASLLSTPEYKSHTALLDFLNASKPSRAFDLEDALPSTLGRKAALQLRGQKQEFFTTPIAATATNTTPIAASYYPDWASVSPSQIDYSKFNIIFFGKSSVKRPRQLG